MAVRKSVLTVKLVKEEYDCFDVYKDGDYHTFIHISVNKKEKLYRGIFEYFFDEQKLLRYAEHKTNLHFEPTQKNYCTLFTHLLTYLDEENIEKSVDELSNIVKEVLLDEEEVEEKDGKLYIRKDKIGKIGEYIFSCILYDYYKFDCIIPKILLGTDPNMNVYGIDALFYSEKNNLLMFGEAKFSKKLDNGIKLIKESLKDYEKQLRQEFLCVLNKRIYQGLLYKFSDLYGDKVAISTSMDMFIKKAEIKNIGIPIFIAHGEEIDPKDIVEKLKDISLDKVLGLTVSLIAISLPVIDKKEFVAYFTEYIRERLEQYNARIQ